MIDFRYHLVSIVAVFLALAIGIIVGATALKPATESVLHALIQREKKINGTLSTQNAALSGQVAGDEAFARAIEPLAVRKLLSGQQVVLVTAPGADGQATSGLAAAIRMAGATVTGQVILQSAFFDASPAGQARLSQLATTLAGQDGVSLPAGTAAAALTGQQTAAQVLAAAIVTRDGAGALSATQRQAILAGFGQENYVQVTGQPGGTALPAATMAVVVIPASPPPNDSDPQNAGLIDAVQALKVSSKAVLLAGTIAGSGPGSAIDDVTSGAAGITVSTVNNADTVTGQIIAVQALRLLLQPDAKPAAYGITPATAPSPAPSAAPSASSPAPPRGSSSSPAPGRSRGSK